MSTITILHLSDIHFKPRGLETEKTFSHHVRKGMMAAIKGHLDANPAPEVAAVTGDIAYSGKEEEYQEAKEFFKSLKELLPQAVLYLVVPGNHDVDRAEISPFFSLHAIVRDQKIDQFQENKREFNKNIIPKFRAFRGFIDDFTPGLYQSKEDYFWVKDVGDKGVSFLGLNSCWACENDKDKDNITLGYPQVMDAFRQAKMPGCILLMHHPPKWLNEIDFDRYEGEIFKRCGLILHGHTHSDKALVVKNPFASCICLGANASYTDEKKHGFIGFQFVRVEFHREGAAVKVWPYRLETRGGLRFEPDTHRWQGQGGKPFFDLKTFEEISPPKKGPKGKSPLPPEIPKEYREWVKEFYSTMDIDLLAKKGEVITVNLPEVYISIETANPFYKKEQEQLRKTRGDKSPEEPGEETEAEAEGKEPASIDIEELVGRKHRLLLRGGAGTGKTTLIKHLAYTITSGSCYPALNGYLPVMIFLRDLWLIFSEELKTKKKVVFEDLLALYLEKSKCPLTIDTINNYLAHHQVLFLIDGLDEVPEHLRADLVEMMAHFQFENKGNSFLLTGRPHGIAGRAASRFGSDLHDIEPLNDRMVKDFIKKWFHAVSGRAKGVGDVTAESMISDIHQHEHISMFTQNPLLLTAVCILYQDGKRIPEQRADLYNRIVDNLINRRFHDPVQPGKENEILEFLMHLAFTTQQKNRKTIDNTGATESLKTILKRRDDEREAQYELRIANVFNEIEPNCGLFNRLSSGEFEFTHQTFQEFLAAKHMLYMDTDWREFLEKDWWEESLLLYITMMNIDRKRISNEIVHEMLNMNHPRIQFLGAKTLRDFQSAKRDEKVVALARQKLIKLIESSTDLVEQFEETESHLKKAKQLENEARTLIKNRKYLNARVTLQVLIELEPEREHAMQNEFGFLYDFKNPQDKDKEQWIEKKEVIIHWKNLWCVLSENNNFQLKIKETKKSTLPQKEETPVEKQKVSEKTKEPTDAVDHSQLTSHEKGELLEEAVLRLFRKFFVIAEDVEETILLSLRKQKKGSQFGFDISFECITRDNEKVTCKIECKNVEDSITEKDISHKLLAVEDSDQEIDHWILFSVRSDTSNYLKELLVSWKEKERFPFEIHAWSPETGIKEFFGLEPSIYEKFYGNETINNNHPKNWTEQKKREVYEIWKDKLKVKPFAHLPKVWKEYIKNPGRMLLKEERERSKELGTLYNNRVELRCKDKKSTLLNGTMEDNVRQWLEDEKKNVMFILGEFGDGKTTFTYFLSRNLALDFLNDPDNGWIPVRFSLSDYQFAKDPQTFLQRRLGEFNADPGSWNDLRNEKKRILIILDGFDEMTPKLDSLKIKKNIKDLTDCCNKEFNGMKIIITSRTHFFENKQDEKRLLQRLNNPPIFYLASIDRKKRIEYFERSIKDPQRKEVFRTLCKLHDPLDLASKPLFLQMFEATLNKFQEEKPDESKLKEINEISIYDDYIKETLNRKIDLLDSQEIVDLEDLVSNLKKILEQIAIKLQESNFTYISLEILSEEFGQKYDEILWKISGSGKQVNEPETEKYDSSEDAAARVQVRSLLARVAGYNKEEKRLVKFCHRSMREYFVAKGICRALLEDKKRAGELLAKLPLNHEILYFTAQLMKKDNSPNYKNNLLEITKSSLNSMTNESPGGNSITLLFRLLGALPDDDWSGLNLDGANLSGADLSGMKFKGTSMRYANLDNVIFEEADFRGSDLTGVRIEETAPVLAVTTRHMDNRIFAAYKDNTIREWKSILNPGNAESRIVLEDTNGDVIGLEIFNGSAICGVTNEEMIFYEFNDNEMLIQKARFRIKPGYRRLLTKGNILLLLSEIEKHTNKLHLVDLDKFEEVYSVEQEKISLFENFDLQAFAVTDGKEYLRVEETKHAKNEEILNISLQETTSLCVYTCEKDKKYLLAYGQSNGNVSVWQVERLNGKWDHKLLVKNQIHDGMVSTLSFLDDTRIVSGGIDRKIYILKFGEDSDDLKGYQENILHMAIKCKGMKIDGLKGSKELEMFKKLIQRG